jgi:Tol biopolymer transport system component
VHTEGVEMNAEISPDGRWLAFDSTESGKAEVYVRPFPNVRTGRWQISNGGGSKPAWSRDGKELFYEETPGTIAGATVYPGTTFSSGVPTRVLDGRSFYVGSTTGRTWDVAPDGRFLLIRDPAIDPATAAQAIVVVLNWVEELKSKFQGQAR